VGRGRDAPALRRQVCNSDEWGKRVTIAPATIPIPTSKPVAQLKLVFLRFPPNSEIDNPSEDSKDRPKRQEAEHLRKISASTFFTMTCKNKQPPEHVPYLSSMNAECADYAVVSQAPHRQLEFMLQVDGFLRNLTVYNLS